MATLGRPYLLFVKAPRLVTALAFGAFFATASTSTAVVYTPAQFATALEQKIGTKRNAVAYNAAASLLKSALGDKNNKGLARTYMTLVVRSLEDHVQDRLQPFARNTLIRGLLSGYFKGMRSSVEDENFLGALYKALATLPESAKTATTAQLIIDTVKSFMVGKGGNPAGFHSTRLNAAVYGAMGLTPPSS
jgi:hypothetical protein